MAGVEADCFRPDSGPANDEIDDVSPCLGESTVTPNGDLPIGESLAEIGGRGEELEASEDEEVCQPVSALLSA